MSNINDNKMKELEDKIKELRNEIEVLDLWLTIASENGVFSKGSEGSNDSSSQSILKTFEEAQEQLKDVWDKLYKTSNSSSSINIRDYETTLSCIFEFYNSKIANLYTILK
ncbi:MAG: hypothetical protein QXN32_02545 [Candidatus Nitrosocaldus sp.]